MPAASPRASPRTRRWSVAPDVLIPRMRGLPRLQATSSPGYRLLLHSSAYAPSRCFSTSITSCDPPARVVRQTPHHNMRTCPCRPGMPVSPRHAVKDLAIEGVCCYHHL